MSIFRIILLKRRPEFETVNKQQLASWLFVEFVVLKVVGATSSENFLVSLLVSASQF